MQQAAPRKNRSAGRPRSAESEAAVIAATAELLKEMSLRDLSIEEIARRAGVGKQTIYRWWNSKSAVALEAFCKTMLAKVEVPDTGSLFEDMVQQLHSVTQFYRSKAGAAFRQFLAEAQSDDEFKKTFLKVFLRPRRDAVRVMWERAIERGEIAADTDPEIAMDSLYGPLIFRLMSGHGPLSQSVTRQIARNAFWGVAAEKTRAAFRTITKVSER
jgi:AcrR family transcriptional regulator